MDFLKKRKVQGHEPTGVDEEEVPDFHHEAEKEVEEGPREGVGELGERGESGGEGDKDKHKGYVEGEHHEGHVHLFGNVADSLGKRKE